MKNLKILAFIMLNIVLISTLFAQTTNPNQYTCELVQNPPPINPSYIGGQYKPESIDRYTSNSTAVFPVLIVFVQFYNDQGPDVDYWHPGQAPTFLNNIISTSKHTNTNWWQAYSESNERCSDAWMQISRGHLHVVGQAVSVVLQHEYTYYQQYGGDAMGYINVDLPRKNKHIVKPQNLNFQNSQVTNNLTLSVS